MGLFKTTVNAIKSGLWRTRSALATPLAAMRGRTIDNESINELERLLLSSDVGPTTTGVIVNELRDAVSKGEKQNRDILRAHYVGSNYHMHYSKPLLSQHTYRRFHKEATLEA